MGKLYSLCCMSLCGALGERGFGDVILRNINIIFYPFTPNGSVIWKTKAISLRTTLQKRERSVLALILLISNILGRLKSQNNYVILCEEFEIRERSKAIYWSVAVSLIVV